MPVLMAACFSSPRTAQEFRERGESGDYDLFERIRPGLPVFDERKADGHYELIGKTLTMVPQYRRLFQLSAAQGVDAGTLDARREKLSSGAWRWKKWSLHVCH